MDGEVGKVYAERYEIIEEVGRGGMAVVYKAMDRRIHRTVALKVLYPYLAIRKENKIRFQREARVVGRLRHKNIVEIFDYSGIDSGENFIVSEFIEGTTLKEFMAEREVMPAEIAAMVVEQIAGALDHAHRNGIVHRDVKPENIMIGAGGVMKLMDFGIAQIRDFDQMTVTGTMIGSPSHMSPEHIEGKKLDPRADVFSLGTVLYSLCVGDLPFQGSNPHALLKNIVEVRYVPAIQRNAAVGDRLSGIIDRCLMHDPEERYQTCAGLRDDLKLLLGGSGLGSSERELPLFFADPDGRRRIVHAQIVNSLLDRARNLSSSGRFGEALRLFDRALAMDKHRPDVMEELNRVRRRLRGRTWLRRLVFPALVVGIAGGGLSWALLGGWLNLGDSSHSLDREGRMKGSVPAVRTDVSPDRRLAAMDEALDVVSREEVEELAPLPDVLALSFEPDAKTGEIAATPVSKPIETLEGENPAYGELTLDVLLRGRTALPRQRKGVIPLAVAGRNLGSGPAARRAIRANSGASANLQRKLERGEAAVKAVQENKEKKEAEAKAEIVEGDGGTKGEQAVMLPVAIEGFPPAVEIWVDGRKVGAGKVENTPLLEGSHEMRLHHPSCDVCQDLVRTFQLSRSDPPRRLKERIRFKPASIRIESSHSGLVFVDGTVAGRTDDLITVKADSHRPWTVPVKILYDKDEMEPYEGRVRVQAGRTTVIQPH